MTTNELKIYCEQTYSEDWVPQKVKELVFNQAWEMGHSSGEQDVMYYYDDLMDIVREFKPR